MKIKYQLIKLHSPNIIRTYEMDLGDYDVSKFIQSLYERSESSVVSIEIIG